METVLAKTKKSFMAAYIIVIVCGAIMFLCGLAFVLFSPLEVKFSGLYFFVAGALFLGLGIGYTVYFAKLPKNCITFKDGKMKLHNGLEFSPAEIDYCTGSTWLNWALYDYGPLVISVRGQEYKYKFVAQVESVAANIKALKTQFTAIEEVQKHIAEKKAAEEAQAAEPAPTVEPAQNTENKD
ncbi:MAG: hypothetical protein K2O28_00650 [Clostridia bacterium]|nr:hypothetical protein [Clostridia bacterium]